MKLENFDHTFLEVGRLGSGLDGLLISTESIEYTEFIDNFKMIEEPTITGKE